MVASMLRNEHALVETVFACARIAPSLPPERSIIAGEVAEYVNDPWLSHSTRGYEFADRFEDTGVEFRISFGDVTPSGWED